MGIIARYEKKHATRARVGSERLRLGNVLRRGRNSDMIPPQGHAIPYSAFLEARQARVVAG